MMQAVLCIVLAGSVALAEWVAHDRRVNGSVKLGAVQQMGPIGVRLPAGWKLLSQSTSQLEVEESGVGDDTGRTLVIVQERKIFAISPERKFRYSNIRTEPIQIGPYEGVLAAARQRSSNEIVGELEPLHDVLIAECLSPKGLAIGIQLDCPAAPTEDDKQLIRQIAKAIVVPGKP